MEIGGLPVVPWGAATAAITMAALALVMWLWLRRRRARSPEARLSAVTHGLLKNFLIPDGDGGEIHIDYAVLTAAGILILDLREVDGHVFGANAMQDWTVIADRRRYTFANPQPALYDRVAAMKRLLPDVPADGLIVFGKQADFSKGLPDHVMMLEELLAKLRTTKRERPLPSPLSDAWANLQREAVSAQLGQLMRG